LGDNELQRCPSWNLCTTSSQPFVHLYSENASLQIQSVIYSTARFSENQVPGVTSICYGSNSWCKQILCGFPINVESRNGSYQNWWFKTDASGWRLGCTDSTDCSITVADAGNVKVVAIPTNVDSGAAYNALVQQSMAGAFH
jgi:hypothetical protein